METLTVEDDFGEQSITDLDIVVAWVSTASHSRNLSFLSAPDSSHSVPSPPKMPDKPKLGHMESHSGHLRQQ